MAKNKKKEKPEEAKQENAAPALPPIDKVGLLLLYLEAIEPETTKNIYEHLGEENAQKILNSIANLGKVDKSKIKPVISEAHSILIDQSSLVGGRNLSGKIIKNIYGEQVEAEIIEEDTSETENKEKPFVFLSEVDDEKLLDFFEKNSLAMAAFLFSLINQDKAAGLIPKLDQEKAQEIMQKSLGLKVKNLPILKKLEEDLKEEFSKSVDGVQINPKKQVQNLTQILEMLGEDQRNSILEQMKKDNKEVAEEIEAKIFTFADLINCGDEDIALIVTDIKNMKSLAFATNKCDEKLKEKLMNNLSARQKEILEEELKTMPSTIKPKEISTAQSEILGIARNLEKEEKISPLVKAAAGKEEKKKK